MCHLNLYYPFFLIQGFEWNKYNQTHYDIDNPPPKIVQGYKFNVSMENVCWKEYTVVWVIFMVVLFLRNSRKM